jgi:hypothetical protein
MKVDYKEKLLMLAGTVEDSYVFSPLKESVFQKHVAKAGKTPCFILMQFHIFSNRVTK